MSSSIILKRICTTCIRQRPGLNFIRNIAFGPKQITPSYAMHRTILFSPSQKLNLMINKRRYSTSNNDDGDDKSEVKTEEKLEKDTQDSLLSNRYKKFRDEDAEEVLDATEIQLKRMQAYEKERQDEDEHFTLYKDREKAYNFDDLNLQRGTLGVFEIEDLATILRRENAQDICVIHVPKNMGYTDYLVIITAKSKRHLKALSEFIRKVHKIKKAEDDPFLILEGDETSGWQVLDMGNIVLHMFLRETRAEYDIEMLWTVGYKYDEKSVQRADILTEVEKHSYIADIQPAESRKPHWAY